MMIHARLIVSAILIVLTLPAPAAAATWVIDSSRSSIGFSVRHMIVSRAKGKFTKFSGTIEGDPNDPGSARVEVTIDPASIDTDNADRDRHLRGEDFFDVSRYPKMMFRSTRITRADGSLTLVGELTMHGITKEVALKIDRFSAAGGRARATAKTKVNRKDFKILWNKALDGGGFAVSDEVMIAIDLELVQR